jgi:hypothetical protein
VTIRLSTKLRSVHDYDLVSEVVSSNMPLIIIVVTGNITQRESSTESIIENGTHKYIIQEIKMQNPILLIL